MPKIQNNADHIYRAAEEWKHAYYIQGMKCNLNSIIKYIQKVADHIWQPPYDNFYQNISSDIYNIQISLISYESHVKCYNDHVDDLPKLCG